MPAIATAVSQDVRAAVANKPSPSPAAGIRLYTPDGAQKYVTGGEQAAFLREAEHADRLVRTSA